MWKLPARQGESHHGAQLARDQRGALQVEHELCHAVPAGPGQHGPLPVRGERGGADVRHGQRVRRPPRRGRPPERAQD